MSKYEVRFNTKASPRTIELRRRASAAAGWTDLVVREQEVLKEIKRAEREGYNRGKKAALQSQPVVEGEKK